jgi:superfamily II DNA/RNA helicase
VIRCGFSVSGRVVLRDTLQTLVIDEADLVLLNGYGDDIRTVIHELPTICQVWRCAFALTPISVHHRHWFSTIH